MEAPPGRAPAAFAYDKSCAPMLWIFVAIACVELVVVHLLVWSWQPAAALILSGISLTSVVWFVLLIRSFHSHPVLLDGERLVMRIGTLRSIAVPIAEIAGLRASWDAAFLKSRGVANLALMAYPNVVVELRNPLPGKRGTTAIAHKLDDRAAFVAALERLGPSR